MPKRTRNWYLKQERMGEQKIPLKKFFPGIAWFFIVALLTLLPGKDIPKSNWIGEIAGIDKFVHVVLFGGLTFLFCLPYVKRDIPYKKKVDIFLKIGGCVIVWGITVEFLQKYFVPGRDFELLDWAADSLGVLIAFWICRKMISKRLSNNIINR